MATVGKELQRARKAAGMSQQAVAEKAGVHAMYVSMLERDERSPSLDVFLRICYSLNVPPEKIISRLDRPK